MTELHAWIAFIVLCCAYALCRCFYVGKEIDAAMKKDFYE